MTKHGRYAKLFIAALMRDGARNRAGRLFDETMDEVVVGLGLKTRPVEGILGIAIEHRRPLIEIVIRRVSGCLYRLPTPVPLTRGKREAVRTMIADARKAKGTPLSWRLARVLVEAFRGG